MVEQGQHDSPFGGVVTMAKRIPWVFALSVVPVVVILAVLISPFVRPYIQERIKRVRFDPIAWQTTPLSLTNAVRIRMVDDLLRRYRFHGMIRQQVTSILGQPDQTEYFREWDMVYWLGPERGFMSIDSEWLVFRLGGQSVTDYRIVRD